MNPREELTKLLIDSYDKGVEDVKQEAIIALEKTVAVMVAAEREACCAIVYGLCESDNVAQRTVDAIRARGTT